MTTIQADAADDAAIAAVCRRAIDEEGQLDVFFANVCPFLQKFVFLMLHRPESRQLPDCKKRLRNGSWRLFESTPFRKQSHLWNVFPPT